MMDVEDKELELRAKLEVDRAFRGVVFVDSAHWKFSEITMFREAHIEQLKKEFSFIREMDLMFNREAGADVSISARCRGCESFITLTLDLDDKVVYAELNKNPSLNHHSAAGDYCPGHYDTIEFEIEIPTGEIICTDWIRGSEETFEYYDNEEGSINAESGIKGQILAFAAHNVHHVFVGNTMPNVYRKDNILTVENADDNDEVCRCGQENCDCPYQTYPSIEGAHKVASICTDLWWATIVDKEVARVALVESLGEEEAEKVLDKVLSEAGYATEKIKPGVYKCTYYGRGDDSVYAHVYSKLEWSREIGESK